MPVPVSSQLEPLPGYKLIDRLGRGGFGEVWRVEAPGGLQKAMKFVFGDLNNLDDDNIRAAEQELKALERVKNIRHPFILSLEQWKIVNGQLIIVMELAERNLWDRFKECRGLGLPGIPREELLGYLTEAAEALDLMNTKYHIQHLDVKPQNLFLMFNHVKVADFGLAKAFEGGRGTVTGGVTPVYAGPETFEGYVSRYTDQYSLAIVFQELLTGTRPFNGSNTKQLVMQHLNGTPDLEHLPVADRAVVARGLAKKPEDRWPSSMDLVRALRANGVAPSGSGSVGREEATANRSPRTISAATQMLMGGDVTPMAPAPEATARTTAEKLQPKPRHGETPAARPRTLGPGQGAAGGNTPNPYGAPRLVTPKTLANQGGLPELRPAATLARPPVVQTARMSDLGLIGPARSGDGALMPAIVVGAGTTGLLVIRALKRILRERFGPEPLPHVRMLYIDTDPEAVAAATDANGPDPLTGSEVFVARLNRAAHYLQRDGLPSVEGWMPKGMLYKLSRNPGAAAGVRAYGRLALADHYKGVVQRIRQDMDAFVSDGAIDAAATRTGLGLRSNRPRVYVVANTCGGTGSGMFLDLAYILKHELRQIGVAKPEVIGELLVPTADKTGSKGTPLANTFAALQELGHFHAGRNRYQARFTNAETITDADGPFARCNLVQLDNRVGPTELAYAAGLVARTLYLELFTPTGRVMDSVRGEAFTLNKAGTPVVQATGVYRLSWPRHELLEIATLRFGQRLLQRWMVKDAAHLREPVQQWLDEQWRQRNLDLEVVVEEFNVAVKDSMREEPERVFAAFVSPLRQRTGSAGRIDHEAAYDVLEQLVKVVGTPEIDPEKPPSLAQVLAERHKRLAADFEGHLSAMAVAFIEQPQYRLGGAEEVLAQMIARLKRTVSGLESIREGIWDDAHDAYSQIAQMLAGEAPSLALSIIGSRKAVTTAEFLGALESYPNKRLRLHVLDATLSIYRKLLASAPEFVREIGYCRQRLQEIHDTIPAPDRVAPYLTGPGRMILPHGVEGLDGAADHFLGALAPQDILDFDATLQTEVAKKYRSLVNVCVHPQHATGFQQLLATHSRKFLESRLDKADTAEVFFRHRGESAPNTPKMLMNSFEEAAPDLTSVSGKPQMEATILAAPTGPAGDRFRQTAEALLPGIGFIPATLSDDIAFVREYPLLPLAELPQLAPHAREAYAQQLAAENNPHTRGDVPWVPADAPATV
jgi:eukaryotic-like serine/threonine-protein kinase